MPQVLQWFPGKICFNIFNAIFLLDCESHLEAMIVLVSWGNLYCTWASWEDIRKEALTVRKRLFDKTSYLIWVWYWRLCRTGEIAAKPVGEAMAQYGDGPWSCRGNENTVAWRETFCSQSLISLGGGGSTWGGKRRRRRYLHLTEDRSDVLAPGSKHFGHWLRLGLSAISSSCPTVWRHTYTHTHTHVYIHIILYTSIYIYTLPTQTKCNRSYMLQSNQRRRIQRKVQGCNQDRAEVAYTVHWPVPKILTTCSLTARRVCSMCSNAVVGPRSSLWSKFQQMQGPTQRLWEN